MPETTSQHSSFGNSLSPTTKKKQAIQCAMKVMAMMSLINFVMIYSDSEVIFSSNLMNILWSLITLSNLSNLMNLIIFKSLNN